MSKLPTTERPCPKCGHVMNKDGRNMRNGTQRYKCPDCGKKTSDALTVTTKHFGGFLRDLRNSKNMSLSDVAAEIGTTKGWLSRIENGSREISINDLFRLAQVYNVRASDMLFSYEKLFYGNDENVL